MSKRAVVVGAGPSGILACINLLKNGWSVTLIEKGAKLASDADFNRVKSWTIGIQHHGTDALKSIPGLWETVEPHVINIDGARLFLFGKDRELKINSSVIDRNVIVSQLLKFLESNYSGESLNLHFDATVCYVDGRAQTVLYKVKNGDFQSVEYDLLVGADGSRSVVRNSLFSQHRNFECSQESIFQSLKSIFMKRPEQILPTKMHAWPGTVRGTFFMSIPSRDDHVNLIVSVYDNNVVDEELLSTDAEVVRKYLSGKFQFELTTEQCQEIASSRWYRSQRVYCNFYHLDVNEGSAILMGDAAHATSPALGNGMNQALADAHCLGQLLQKYNNDLERLLPDYSLIRVKEGRALTDMSSNLQPLTIGRQIKVQFGNMIRSLFHKLTFGYVQKPVDELFSTNLRMSEMYQVSLGQNIKSRRQYNAGIIQQFQYQQIGLEPHTKSSSVAANQKVTMASLNLAKLHRRHEEAEQPGAQDMSKDVVESTLVKEQTALCSFEVTGKGVSAENTVADTQYPEKTVVVAESIEIGR